MIERLDAHARRWPLAGRSLYLGLKWVLVALGAYIVIGLSIQRMGVWGSLIVWGGFFAAGFVPALIARGRSRPSTPASK